METRRGGITDHFCKKVSSGHLLVFKQGVNTFASCLKRTCIRLDTTRSDLDPSS